MHTPAQEKLLSENAHFHVIDVLRDGDLLIIDLINRPRGSLICTHAEEKPYILDRKGNVQALEYHYRYYHNQNIHAYRAERSPPSMHGPAHLHNLN